MVESKRFELLHDAILEALRLIDCDYSHRITSSENASITKQDAKTENFRACYSRLVLSCSNPAIIDLFIEITLDKLEVPALMLKLNEFGEQLEFNEDKVWFASTARPPE